MVSSVNRQLSLGKSVASNVHEPFCAQAQCEDSSGVSMDRHLIEGFEACGPRLRQAVAGMSPEELTARPGPGDWSILELVIHLADSDSIAIDRMKRMLIEDNPQLLYADETAYVRLLASHEQSLEDALTLFELGRLASLPACCGPCPTRRSTDSAHTTAAGS